MERLSEEHPQYRYEITAHGLVEVDTTPPKNQHGNIVARLSAWLAAAYGWDRVTTEAGVNVSRTDPEPYRQVDLALFNAPFDPQVRYNDPADIALVVEVLSPTTEMVDKISKFEEFEAVAIPHYWLVDPEQGTAARYRYTPGGYRPAGVDIRLADLFAREPETELHLNVG